VQRLHTVIIVYLEQNIFITSTVHKMHIFIVVTCKLLFFNTVLCYVHEITT